MLQVVLRATLHIKHTVSDTSKISLYFWVYINWMLYYNIKTYQQISGVAGSIKN